MSIATQSRKLVLENTMAMAIRMGKSVAYLKADGVYRVTLGEGGALVYTRIANPEPRVWIDEFVHVVDVRP